VKNEKAAKSGFSIFGAPGEITGYILVACPSGSLRYAQTHSKFIPDEFVELGARALEFSSLSTPRINRKATKRWPFYLLARPARFELTTPAFGGQYSIQLSYGRLELCVA
jgi:hypothetical protein